MHVLPNWSLVAHKHLKSLKFKVTDCDLKKSRQIFPFFRHLNFEYNQVENLRSQIVISKPLRSQFVILKIPAKIPVLVLFKFKKTNRDMRELTLQNDGLSSAIFEIRGQKVMLDADLAEIYGVETKRINEVVRRNTGRFPKDFMFQLTKEEYDVLRSQIATSKSLRSQFATLKKGRGQHRKYMPHAFTEHGTVMLATLLKSPQAIQASIFVVRAFVQMRQFLAQQNEIAKRVEDLEAKIDDLEERHDEKFQKVFEAFRQLVRKENEPRKRIDR